MLEKNSLLATLPTLAKEWRISFDLKPKSYNNGFAQVLQLTIGGKATNIGDRTPALWMYKKSGVIKVVIATTLNGKVSVAKFLDKKIPFINQWTSVEIGQERKGSDYIFSLVMRGETLQRLQKIRGHRSSLMSKSLRQATGMSPSRDTSEDSR